MRKILVSLLLVIMLAPAVQAQNNDSYAKALKTMLDVSGSEEAYKTVVKQMLGMFKAQYSQVPAAVMNELEKEFLNASLDELAEMLVPVYKKHLTIGDINGLTKFYQTPLGKKFAQKTPAIMQESMSIGQQWGMAIGQKFAAEIKEKGY